jgi:ribonuclease BN (tRNA processing enzyme)
VSLAPRVVFPEPADAVSSELRLTHSDLELVGTSVAALATAFVVASHRTAVDMGRCSGLLAAQETLLLTHCHSDHVAGLVAWLSAHTRRHEGTPTRIVVPAERRDTLLHALEIWPELDGVRRRVDLSEVLVPARVGDRFHLAGGGWARAFEVHHSVPSLGWAIGTDDTRRPDYVFAGDGTVQPFEAAPETLDGRLAVVDCSFVDGGTRVAARLGGHAHLHDWLQILPKLPCDVLILSHLPADIRADRLLSELDGLGPGGPVVVPWLEPPP